MPLGPGTRIGPYEVTGTLGAGGMGEVYRGHDIRLKRDVALKILPESFATDAERLARFQREAELLASLNHPHIAAIHGLEESDGRRALVLELVEGETLAERIARGPISVDEALPIAKQIAEALEAAHEQGIIHRDLKPANIKLRPDGMVKVLDFGLAKLNDPSTSNPPSALNDPNPYSASSPTITSPAMMSGVGVLLGTAAYMSPEQAKGRSADKRSDVWAFACVLFEMLAGKRAFEGHETSDVIARVITAEPQWSALPAEVSPTLLAYLRRCFHKDPKQRLRDIGDLRLAMEGAFDPLPSHPAASGLRSSAQRWRYALLATGAVLIATIAISVGILSARRPSAHVPVRFSISVPPSGWPLNPNGPPLVALSPDGRTIVYAGRDQLYRRDVGQLESQPVPGTASAVDNINTPFFSPDGRWVGFFRAGALRKVALAGGAPTVILEAVPRGASWGLDDAIVYGTNAGLMRVSASGGDPEPVTSVVDGEAGHYRPDILPNGKAVLFTIWSGSVETAKIGVVSLETRERRVLFAGSYPRYASTGHIVFVRESSMWAVPFDADRLEVTGRPAPILDDVLVERASGVGQFAIANNGSLVYAAAGARTERRRLVWVSRGGMDDPLELEAGPYSDPSVSPDGSRVAMTVTRGDNIDIWVWHVMRRTFERFTFDDGPELTPLWSADGSRLVFQTATGLSWKPLVTGGAERLLDNPNRPVPAGWTPDGRIIFNETAPAMRNIGVASIGAAAKAQILLGHPRFYEQSAALSPDGRWLAYQSDESGTSEVYVRPFPDVESRTWQVSGGGGSQPKWSSDGRELYYRASGNLMVTRIQTAPGFSRTTPEVLFSMAGYVLPTVNRAYDVSQSGRFLLMKTEGNETGRSQSGQELVFVQSWFDELQRLVPAK